MAGLVAMEKRIIELETKVSFQDYLLEELNDVVTRQQRQIDLLEKELRAIKKRLLESPQPLAGGGPTG